MANTESAENYLETILILSKRLPVVRSVDVATELGFKKSSVSIAMKNLRQKQHISNGCRIHIFDRLRPRNRGNDLRKTSAHLKLAYQARSSGGDCYRGCMPYGTRY